jgi:alpha-amylase
MEDYPDIPFVLHTSGPLAEWLAENQPRYIERVRALACEGRVEVLGGGFFEPILTMIPHRDRVGQIRGYAAYLRELFGVAVRGIWVPERVWEQSLVPALSEAGVEYTVLDDIHFRRAGLGEADLYGYYLTEDDGRLVKVFPNSERLRYLVPFHEPHESYEFLKNLAQKHPGATVVCGDDGEKFGAWPDTYDHVFTRGWLRRFCDMIRANRDWLHPTTFAEAVDETLPLGKVYLPDGSYREMTEWALPTERQVELNDAMRQANGHPVVERLRPFVRAGGFWRNFKVLYEESDEMYTRMLGVSKRLAAAEASADTDPDYIDAARQDLYRAQCNCAYWHGTFGGLYLPHLRNAVYRHLIAADNALDEAEGRNGPRVSAEVADFNLDARQEIRLENGHLVAFVRPARGGHVYELDVRDALTNVLNTLDRRPEPYHAAITGHAGNGPTFVPDRVVLKEGGLGRRIVYDRSPRKALVDHVFPLDVTLEDLALGREVERGDFVQGAYLSRLLRGTDRVALTMERKGRAEGHVIQVGKSLEMKAGSPSLEVAYTLEGLPEGVALHFAIEFNIASMAGHADDRYYSDGSGARLGLLDSRLELAGQTSVTLTDEWLDLSVGLSWSRPAGLWCLPVETVSQSEGGFEAVYQSSAVIPHWVVVGDESGRWEIRIQWTFGRASTGENGTLPSVASLVEAASR